MRKIRALLVLTFVVIVFIVPGRIQADNRGELLAAQGSEELDTYAPDGRFIPGDRRGVVKDTKTGLEWFAGPDKDTTWDEAKAWTESLSVDGGGWRMPTRDEVKGLHTKGAGPHNVSPLFKTAGGFVWTGEIVGSSHAWGFCLDIGDEYFPRRTYSETARGFAVRSGKR
jgi:hypothetical protein